MAGLKLMAIKTPLAPHPIHYEQHPRRRRSSLVLPVFLACLACLGDTKLAAVARIPKHAGTAGSPAPPHPAHRPPFRAPSFQISLPTDASTASSQGLRSQGWPSCRAGLPVSHRQGRVHNSHDPRPPTAAIRQFHMLLSEICPVLCRALHAWPVFQHVDRRTRLRPEDRHFVPLCSAKS